MTAPTHIIFAVAIGQFAGINPLGLKLLGLGAILPDIDHPQSTLGRILFFLSIPLKKRYGHRKTVHGFFLWGLVAGLGFLWKPALYLGMGALLHTFLDAWNVSGVQALEPFSEKVCVIFDRKWRIVTGSKAELVIFLVFSSVFWAGGYVSAVGGMRALAGEMLGSYQIAYERYLKEGLKVCHLEGKIRTAEGSILEGKWLIIGKENVYGRGVALMVNEKIFHVPENGHFLRAKLRVSETEKWETMKLEGFAETDLPIFYLGTDGYWKKAEKGMIVTGTILGEKIELDAATVDRLFGLLNKFKAELLRHWRSQVRAWERGGLGTRGREKDFQEGQRLSNTEI
jgi:inner membrane protein